jgi:hypothetical protein
MEEQSSKQLEWRRAKRTSNTEENKDEDEDSKGDIFCPTGKFFFALKK